MSKRYYIVRGDTTYESPDSEVLEGDPGNTVDLHVAHVGCKVRCGTCGIVTTIASGSAIEWTLDHAVARDGDKLACGHTLKSVKQRLYCEVDGDDAPPPPVMPKIKPIDDVFAEAGIPRLKDIMASSPMLAFGKPRFHEQFRLIDDDEMTPLTRVKYEIESESGKKWTGYSDEHGLTQHVYTDKPECLSLTIYEEIADDDAPSKG